MNIIIEKFVFLARRTGASNIDPRVPLSGLGLMDKLGAVVRKTNSEEVGLFEKKDLGVCFLWVFSLEASVGPWCYKCSKYSCGHMPHIVVHGG